MTYQSTEAAAVDAIKKAIPDSLKQNMLKSSKGLSAELYENNEVFPNHYLATAIDSVGTKIILAEALNTYDTVGIDCVAMSANDLATMGNMSPFIFMDCLLTQSKFQEEKLAGKVIKGISKALAECDASNILKNSIKLNFGKGETASVNEILSSTKEGYGFDLIGCMIGFVEKSKLITKVNPGDKIVALKSSGPHSNGFTDLRHHLLNGDFETRDKFKKQYKGKFGINDDFYDSTIGKTLLEPTKLYVKDMAKISKKFEVVGINNTGYGLKNFNRINQKVQFIINNPIKPQPIFDLMQTESDFTDEQMYTTFNMGMGFFVVCKKENADDILSLAKDSQIVGEVKESGKTQTILEKGNNKLVFEGY